MQNNNPSNNKVKYSIAQLNHNRSRPVHEFVHQLLSCNHFSVLLGQEQNKKTKVMYSDKRNDCFINIYDSRRIEKRFCDERFVVVETEDISFVSCYFSPNRNNQDFSEFLYRLSCFIHSTSKPVVIGGDMNAKTAAIGSAVTDDRGEMLEDWTLPATWWLVMWVIIPHLEEVEVVR